MHYTVSTKKRLHAFSEPNFYVLHYTKENQTHPHAPTSCLKCYSFVFKKKYTSELHIKTLDDNGNE